MLTSEQQSALNKIAAAAVASERATGLPAELSAAQAIYESCWLSRAPNFNVFGIKADGHGSGVQYCLTEEFLNGEWEKMPLAFEKYNSLTDCFTDHARLITCGDNRYAPAWRQYQTDHDFGKFVLAIGPIYATAPNYGAIILREANSSTVAAAVQAARAAAQGSTT